MGAVSSRFRSDIEGLRAVAVLLVVLAHAGVPRLAGRLRRGRRLLRHLRLPDHRAAARARPTARGGRRSRGSTRAACAGSCRWPRWSRSRPWWRRTSSAGRRTATTPRATPAGSRSSSPTCTSRAERLDYFAPAGFGSPLEHFWSLAVEEQFYLVWPLLVVGLCLLVRAPRARRLALAGLLALITVASVAWSVHQTGTDVVAAYYSPFTRAEELAAGGAGRGAGPEAHPAGPGVGRPRGRPRAGGDRGRGGAVRRRLGVPRLPRAAPGRWRGAGGAGRAGSPGRVAHPGAGLRAAAVRGPTLLRLLPLAPAGAGVRRHPGHRRAVRTRAGGPGRGRVRARVRELRPGGGPGPPLGVAAGPAGRGLPRPSASPWSPSCSARPRPPWPCTAWNRRRTRPWWWPSCPSGTR